MAKSSNSNLVTTFILLQAHEPSDPPSITDAGSQAGQAFNQVLRYIAGCTGFDSQLFGWPSQPEDKDVNWNDHGAAIMPGTLAIFTNWKDSSSAGIFLSPASLRQAFQGFTTFFETPKAVPSAGSLISFATAPLALSITWQGSGAAHKDPGAAQDQSRQRPDESRK
ncbi:uncharacterized protein AB675_3386 [Cyphellophora attinorum]|uniref:Uncharacterized protein n=1 Tax=Cyphellophora attinorum TaxID=1664694 RepID=A0A0N0NLP1_9EURO|nr:uncharacterized protein AB675_3386 [Phialophora attinorum]KPI39531.1 hypothetical protein AB675_3386 [Phialophora attinorum]